MLMYAVQDEYLARGEYLAIIDKFRSQTPYDNIAMYELFLSYDLPENVYEVFNALKKGSDSHFLFLEV